MRQKLALLVIILLMATPVVAQEQKPKDTLVISISKDFEPFTFLNAEGKPAGMFVDIWRLWAQKTGKKIEFVSSDWKTSLENLKNQKADIHSGQLYSSEHIQWISVSQPFYEVGVSLFYPAKQGKVSDINELSGHTVAVIHGSQLEQFLKKNYPGIRVYPCDTREELAKVSREGKSKGFIAIWSVGAALIDRMGLSGEFEIYDKILYKEKFLSGVLKNNTELLALVDKGFNAISYQERAEIEARWIPDPAKRYYKTSNIIQLTPAEEAWLRNHKTIRVGMSPIFPPLKFSEKGVIKGIEPDYLNILSEYTGIQFEYVVSFPLTYPNV
jgi:ABC-type amino acid transport substrate-binding protein